MLIGIYHLFQLFEKESQYFKHMLTAGIFIGFSLLTNMFAFMLDRIESQNIRIGKFVASNQKAIIDFYYTPTVLTTNALIFNKEKMTTWWQSGFKFAKYKNEEISPLETE